MDSSSVWLENVPADEQDAITIKQKFKQYRIK
jgi:hypothetical protein